MYEGKLDKEYLPITGLGDFLKASAKLALGSDSPLIKENRVHQTNFLILILTFQVAIAQSISGTGALRIGGEFLDRWYKDSKKIYLPTPSWGNHTPIFRDSGLEVNQYRYFDKKTIGLDLKGMLEDIQVSNTFGK